MTKTFQQYLQDAFEAGAIDFRLRIFSTSDGNVRFYLHPHDRDGDTGDYHAVGNLVLPYAVEGLPTAIRQHVSGLQDAMPDTSCPLCHSVIGDVMGESPWFVALRGGMTPHTAHGPAEPWVEGAQLCPHCGHIWETGE